MRTKRVTSKDVIKSWLLNNYNFNTHNIAERLPKYGLHKFGVLYSGGTYDRKFRELKAEKSVNLEEYYTKNSREKHYKVRSASKIMKLNQ